MLCITNTRVNNAKLFKHIIIIILARRARHSFKFLSVNPTLSYTKKSNLICLSEISSNKTKDLYVSVHANCRPMNPIGLFSWRGVKTFARDRYEQNSPLAWPAWTSEAWHGRNGLHYVVLVMWNLSPNNIRRMATVTGRNTRKVNTGIHAVLYRVKPSVIIFWYHNYGCFCCCISVFAIMIAII